jgi:hypothetical protein
MVDFMVVVVVISPVPDDVNAVGTAEELMFIAPAAADELPSLSDEAPL